MQEAGEPISEYVVQEDDWYEVAYRSRLERLLRDARYQFRMFAPLVAVLLTAAAFLLSGFWSVVAIAASLAIAARACADLKRGSGALASCAMRGGGKLTLMKTSGLIFRRVPSEAQQREDRKRTSTFSFGTPSTQDSETRPSAGGLVDGPLPRALWPEQGEPTEAQNVDAETPLYSFDGIMGDRGIVIREMEGDQRSHEMHWRGGSVRIEAADRDEVLTSFDCAERRSVGHAAR